jgi:hypothetical protein
MSKLLELSTKTLVDLTYSNFSIEEDGFPFESESLDIVLPYQIIEHLLSAPCAMFRQIKPLRDHETLVLTTPNVNHMENVARMIAGANLYNPADKTPQT